MDEGLFIDRIKSLKIEVSSKRNSMKISKYDLEKNYFLSVSPCLEIKMVLFTTSSE